MGTLISGHLIRRIPVGWRHGWNVAPHFSELTHTHSFSFQALAVLGLPVAFGRRRGHPGAQVPAAEVPEVVPIQAPEVRLADR